MSGFVKDLAGYPWLAFIACGGAVLILISALRIRHRIQPVVIGCRVITSRGRSVRLTSG